MLRKFAVVVRRVASGCVAFIIIGSPILAAAQSSPAQSGAAELAPIAWIAGTWIGHQGDPAPGGADVEMAVRWSPNGRALLMDLTIAQGPSRLPYMSAIYYWHPGTKAITMWQILSAGIVNDGRVIAADNAGLTQELRATDLAGLTRFLHTEFARDGDDAFRFISQSRTSESVPWAAGTTVRFVRKRSSTLPR